MNSRLENSETVIVFKDECFQRVIWPNRWIDKRKDGALRNFGADHVTRQLRNFVDEFFAASEQLPPSF